MSLAITADVSIVHCMGLHGCAYGSCLATEHLFGLLKHWGGHCFLSNEEWNRLFVNGDECESKFYLYMVLFNLYQTGKHASVWGGIVL